MMSNLINNVIQAEIDFPATSVIRRGHFRRRGLRAKNARENSLLASFKQEEFTQPSECESHLCSSAGDWIRLRQRLVNHFLAQNANEVRREILCPIGRFEACQPTLR